MLRMGIVQLLMSIALFLCALLSLADSAALKASVSGGVVAVGLKQRRAIERRAILGLPPDDYPEDDDLTDSPRFRALVRLIGSHRGLAHVRPLLLPFVDTPRELIAHLANSPELLALILRAIVDTDPAELREIIQDDEGPMVTLLLSIAFSVFRGEDGPPVDVTEYINYDRLARGIVNEVGFISLGEGVRQKALTFIRTALKPLGSISVNGYIDYEGLAKELVKATGDGLHALIEDCIRLILDLQGPPSILEQIYERDEDSIVALLYRLVSGDSPPPVDVAEYIDYDRLAREIVNEVGFITLGEGVRHKALTYIRSALKPLGSIPVNGYIDYEGLAKELVKATGDGLHSLIKDCIRLILDLQGPPSIPY